MQNCFRKVAYVSLSLLISLAFFSPRANAAKDTACITDCKRQNLKTFSSTGRKNLNRLQLICDTQCKKPKKQYDPTMM